MNGLALCAGVGGLELGLKLALGDRYRCVGYVERDAYAAATLVARMEDEALDRAPIADDLAAFDARPWRGVVDLVTSGLPCQPYSVAGKRRGHADERALWPEFVRIVRECEPWSVFLENVPSFLKHFEPVWRELRGLGFEWAPPAIWTAEEVGAPHLRRRVFLFGAHPGRERLEGVVPAGTAAGATGRVGRESRPSPDSDSRGLEGQRRGWLLDFKRETLRHDPDGCGAGPCRQPPPWSTESPVLRVADGPPSRVDRLRCIGNAVVPQVAAAAFEWAARQLSPC